MANNIVTLNNGRNAVMFKNAELTKHMQEIDRLTLVGYKQAYQIASHIVAIVNGELFKDDFASETEFCEYIGELTGKPLNQGLLSQWKQAVPYLQSHKDAVKRGYTLKRAYIYSSMEKAKTLEGFQKYCMEKNVDISTDAKLEKAKAEYYQSIGKGKKPAPQKTGPELVDVVDGESDNEVVTAKDTVLAGGKKFVTIQYKDDIISIPRKDFQTFIKKYSS